MTRKTGTTTDAVEILHRRLFEGKPERLKILEEARANEEIARNIFGLRTKAGLTHTQLGKPVSYTHLPERAHRRPFRAPSAPSGQSPQPAQAKRKTGTPQSMFRTDRATAGRRTES